MQYLSILFENGTTLLEEIYSGQLQRYCDFDGNTVSPPSGGSSVIGEFTPSFTPPPDPVPCSVVDTSNVVVPSEIATTQAPIEVLGAPIRTLGWDDKGQIVRIDYPQSGIYQMLEYADGRLRKITEISPSGIEFIRHLYYDNYGRQIQETQL